MNLQIFLRYVLVMSISLVSFRFVPAQTLTSSTVTGFVADGSGAAVPNATIRVTQTESNTVRAVQTGAGGDYRFPFLKPGDYMITAEGAGFSATSIKCTCWSDKNNRSI